MLPVGSLAVVVEAQAVLVMDVKLAGAGETMRTANWRETLAPAAREPSELVHEDPEQLHPAEERLAT